MKRMKTRKANIVPSVLTVFGMFCTLNITLVAFVTTNKFSHPEFLLALGLALNIPLAGFFTMFRKEAKAEGDLDLALMVTIMSMLSVLAFVLYTAGALRFCFQHTT